MPNHYESNRNCSKHCKKRCCKSATKIRECDINHASSHCKDGLVIKKPGNYKLCENVN